MAILRGLIPMAWADGKYSARERELIDALLVAFDANEAEQKQIREYAETPRTLEDIPLTELSYDDRRVLLQHAVLLSYADGSPSPEEQALVTSMAQTLRIPEQEASGLVQLATDRAKRHLPAR